MGKVLVDISVSVDGFIAGPDISVEHPLGKGGLRLHDWFFNPKTEIDKQMMADVTASTGAVILGRTMYDLGIDSGWDGVSPFEVPAYVLTSRPAPEKLVAGFHFVNETVQRVLDEAQTTAGAKNVWIIGGANLIQQYIQAGLVDELRLHTVPVLFGAGTRLFENINTEQIELEKIHVIETPAAIHSRFRLVK